MTEQVQEALAEVDSAPAPEVTATSDTALDAPAEQNSEQTPRVYTEEEFNLHTQKQREGFEKKLAKERRKWEREQQARLATQAQPAQPKDLPAVDQFESPEAYAEALAVRKAEELLQQREVQRQQAELREAYHEREELARDKYDDFEQVAYNPKLPITTVMAETIQASEIGPDLAYWLGSNPKEADRIARLSPLLQAREIGRIEAKLAADPAPTKKASSAPSPISPVTNRASPIAYDTTDPRSTKTMSASEWIEAERARQIRKLQAQANR